MNKKGILDGIYIIIIVLALFLGFSMSKVIWDKTTESGDLAGNYSETRKIVNTYNTRVLPMFDTWFILAILGSFIGVTVLAYIIKGSPIFLPVMVLLLIIANILSTFVSNVHNEIMKNTTIAAAVAGWTMTNFLLENLPVISFFFLVGLTIVMLSMGDTL